MGAWSGSDDAAGDRLRAEHGIVPILDGDELVLAAGKEGLLPPWPPEGHDTIPCPTCWLPADLVAPTAVDVLHHSHCPRGHDNALAPAVLEHLRRIDSSSTPTRGDTCDTS